MSRRVVENTSPDHDSFLDIVANMVGILIILVMVVGIKAKDAASHAAPAPEETPTIAAASAAEVAELHELQKEAASLERTTLDTGAEAQRLIQALRLREQERAYLATQVAAAEVAVEEQTSHLDEEARLATEARVALRQSQDELSQLANELAALEQMPTNTTQVASLPTPISHAPHG